MTTNMIDTEIARLLAENDRRNEVMFAHFDPVTGEGSIGERVRVCISDFAIPVQWLPVEMMKIQMVKKLVKAGSIDKFLSSVLHVEPNDDDYIKVSRKFIRLRFKHDFPFWAATLVYIHNKKAGKDDFAVMASEFPSDDVEAFVHSGSMVFDKYRVKKFERFCKQPQYIGEVYADGDEGEDALSNLRFRADRQGLLSIWAMPETFEGYEVVNRYLTVVDVGGRSNKADWSVIVVFDRLGMIDGSEPPSVVAQWYGHCDIDQLAWRAAQIAAFYDNSLLVIESNTLETHDKERQVEGGDQSQYILNQISDIYPNLYARKQSEDEIREGAPRKYGFHTNVSTKPMIISTLIKVVRDRLYIERDKRCLNEYNTYERKQNGAYGAITGKHDDLLMTRAIGLHICFREMDMPEWVPIVNRTLRKDRSPVSEASI